MNSHIVVGSNFGDEGKGKTVDYLTSTLKNCIVIKSNGGSQAGHTVQDGDQKHVFHHFGSGHYNNVPTYLSEKFISNPLTFFKELEVLKNHKVYVNENSLLTTPYDMMLNQTLEFSRTNRHGSCGLGINETIKRCENKKFKTTIKDISNNFESIFRKLYEDYFEPEFLIRGLKMFEHNVENMFINFSNDCLKFLEHVEIVDDSFLLNFDNLVFENGQGLLLDQDHYNFPHVTHSKTGVHNPVSILKGLGITSANVYYITRPYFTKHGAGDFPFEVENKIYGKIVDETNIPNEFQGTLRFSPFNLDLFKESLEKDIASVDFDLKKNVVITCLDQLPEYECKLIKNGNVEENIFSWKLIDEISSSLKFENIFISQGPDRNHMKKLGKPLDKNLI